MGNTGSSSRRNPNNHQHRPSASASASASASPSGQSQISTNQYVFTAPSHYPNPNLPQYYHHYPPGYCPPPPQPHDYHRYPSTAASPTVVERQKTVTIRNDVNIKKESIRVVEDDENPGKFLVTFTFDANAPGSVTLVFFGKEGVDCNLIPTRESVLKPVTVSFEQGLGQKFKQPSGTGIVFSTYEEKELKKADSEGVYPLILKAEACPLNSDGPESNSRGNSQVTLAVFDKKEEGEYVVRVLNQILWVNGTRYELQEIYGIGNSVDAESDENDPGKECVICMSEPRDTTVLPCRHMCMCSACAKILQFQTKQCPICRQPVKSLLEIKVNNGIDV